MAGAIFGRGACRRDSEAVYSTQVSVSFVWCSRSSPRPPTRPVCRLLSAVHRNAPHRSHVPSDPLNSSSRSTSSWPPRRRRRRNRALPFAFTLRSGLAINRLRKIAEDPCALRRWQRAFRRWHEDSEDGGRSASGSLRRLPRSCRLVFRFLMVWDHKSPSTNNETTAVLVKLSFPPLCYRALNYADVTLAMEVCAFRPRSSMNFSMNNQRNVDLAFLAIFSLDPSQNSNQLLEAR